MERAKKILKSHNLKITPTRLAVLKILMDQNNALSCRELQLMGLADYDRITLYRTLQKFENLGIIHKISSPDGSIKYALCSENCPPEHHYEHHLHFYCLKCGKIYCEDDIDISNIKINSEFYIESLQITAEGLCKNCYKS